MIRGSVDIPSLCRGNATCPLWALLATAEPKVMFRFGEEKPTGATQHVTRVSQALESRIKDPFKMLWFSFPCFGAMEFWKEMGPDPKWVLSADISCSCKCCTSPELFPPWSHPKAPWVSSWRFKCKFIHRIDALLTFTYQKHARIAWEIVWNGQNQQLTLQGNLVQLQGALVQLQGNLVHSLGKHCHSSASDRRRFVSWVVPLGRLSEPQTLWISTHAKCQKLYKILPSNPTIQCDCVYSNYSKFFMLFHPCRQYMSQNVSLTIEPFFSKPLANTYVLQSDLPGKFVV